VNVRKAVITAAARGTRLYPVADTVQKAMLPVIDRDGITKPVLQIIAEEALESGIEEICVVCAPGDQDRYRQRFDVLSESVSTVFEGQEWARQQQQRLANLMRRLSFTEQAEPLGYGHAVYCAREFIGSEPFLLLLGDHLYISNTSQRCAQQLLDLAAREGRAVSAVHATREHLISRYGTVSGKRIGDRTGVYQIDRIIEKPSVSRAELELQVAGLRAGYYLCFFGMHVLTPAIFDLLQAEIARESDRGQVQLTPSLEELARREKYLALEVQGRRYDIGTKYGLLQTQLALALNGSDRDEVLATMVEVLAVENPRSGSPA
jgi:UTP--glucose-1-phosphate uridylyltransferase